MATICIDCLRGEGEGATFSKKKTICNQCRWKRRKKRMELEVLGVGRKGGRLPDTLGTRFPRATDFHTLWSPKNGYPRGHYFNNGEFRETLRQGLFVMGMIVRSREKKYVVCGDGSANLVLKKRGYPLKARFPEQWLTEINGRARR